MSPNCIKNNRLDLLTDLLRLYKQNEERYLNHNIMSLLFHMTGDIGEKQLLLSIKRYENHPVFLQCSFYKILSALQHGKYFSHHVLKVGWVCSEYINFEVIILVHHTFCRLHWTSSRCTKMTDLPCYWA